MDKQSVRCTACKIRCVIKPDDAGVCGIRQNIDGQLYLLVYGLASAVHTDPIEKKPLYHFLPGSEVFSIGTVGCNFACSFCQNWDLSQITRTLRERLRKGKRIRDIQWEATKYGYRLPPEDIVSHCLERQIPSLAYTYNEPIIFFEYLYDTAKLAAGQGIRNVMVSNGYESPEALDLLAPYLDAMNIDLKAFTEAFYKKQCKAKLAPVLDTIREVAQRDIWLEITTLLIPGLNDSEAEVRDIARFIADIDPLIPWHLSAFFPAYQLKDVPTTKKKTLLRACEIGREEGLKFIYVGNVRDEEHSATRCPGCNTTLIRRNGYRTRLEPALRAGRCIACETAIPGVW